MVNETEAALISPTASNAVQCHQTHGFRVMFRKKYKSSQLMKMFYLISGLSLDTNLPMSSVGPQSPLDMKPDTNSLLSSSGAFSPQG